MAKLTYQGHGSLRFVSNGGMVLYLDPFAGQGYDLPADLILVTHDHHDHNRVDLTRDLVGCEILTFREALAGGEYHSFVRGDFSIRAVPAANQNHDPRLLCRLSDRGRRQKGLCRRGHLHYRGDGRFCRAGGWTGALLPIDGVYNMDPKEASRAAALIGAAHSVPIHMKPARSLTRRWPPS